jgi:anti-sigma B factor antagonist
MTAPELEKELRESLSGITELVLDFADLEYISSAGLRVVLGAQKTMNSQGTMVVKNLTEEVRDVFDITGFTDILTIE